jgi:polyisoprenoid-binding protein YceI
MISHVKGSFKTFDADISTHDKDFATADINLWIDVSSISTGDAKRDEHLQSADFFDVKEHKQIVFSSDRMGGAGADGGHELWGNLTMKGITKNIMLEVEFGGMVKDPWGNEKAGFSVTAVLKRSEWGLNWNKAIDTGGLMVGDDVTIQCEIELTNAGKKEMEIEPDHAMPKSTNSK